MATISHESPSAPVRRPWWIEARNLWASTAVAVIWVATLFTVVFGPDIATASVSGDHTVVPSGVAVAFFAVFATWAVAKYGFEKKAAD